MTFWEMDAPFSCAAAGFPIFLLIGLCELESSPVILRCSQNKSLGSFDSISELRKSPCSRLRTRPTTKVTVRPYLQGRARDPLRGLLPLLPVDKDKEDCGSRSVLEPLLWPPGSPYPYSSFAFDLFVPEDSGLTSITTAVATLSPFLSQFRLPLRGRVFAL